MTTPYATRRAIYSLDPNRHLSSSIPFEDYLINLTRRAPKGIPVPEESVKLFRTLLKRDTQPSWIAPEKPQALDASWIQLEKQLVVYDYPASPLPFTGDEEDAWRRKIFTYPPGRYAILRPGPALERLAGTTSSRLRDWARTFRDNRYPLDGIVARGFRDGWALSEKEEQINHDDLWSPEREALNAGRTGNIPKFRALVAAGLDLDQNSGNKQTLAESLLETRDLLPAISEIIRSRSKPTMT